jgi:hypothetical protein
VWAFIKAAFWLLVMIMLIGYLPDRAYYFTVSRTIALGVDPATTPGSYLSVVNLCPPENGDLPCPAPAGSILAWQPSPPELALPAPRVHGGAVQLGERILYVGGTDGSKAVPTTYVATTNEDSFSPWQEGPPLPAPRSDAAVLTFGGSAYVIGGYDEAGQPTTTVFVLTPDPQTGDLGAWQTAADAKLKLDLPGPLAGAAAVAGPDGIFLVGGTDGSAPTKAVWKATQTNGKWVTPAGATTAWTAQAPLYQASLDGGAAIVGDFLWVYGGADAGGPTSLVQVGQISTADGASRVTVFGVQPNNAAFNLPAARTDASTFAANGALYLVGGSDGTTSQPQTYWAVPNPSTAPMDGWKNLPAMDLPPPGLSGAPPLVMGSTVFLFGGESGGQPQTLTTRASLAPQAPFFQLTLLGGVRVPALGIGGEVGQQLGYLAAAGVGTVNFILLIAIGWAIVNREKVGEAWRRFRAWRRRPASEV